MKKILSRIRNKLLIAFAAVVTLPLVIVAIYSTRTTLRALDEAAIESARREAQQVARRVDTVLAAAQMDVLEKEKSASLQQLVAAEDPSVEGGQLIRKPEKQFRVFLQTRPAYRRLVYADQGGAVILRVEHSGERPVAVPAEPTESVAERPFFRETTALPAGQVNVSIDPDAGEITYSTGVFHQRVAKGALALTLSIGTLLEEAGVDPGAGRTALLDRTGEPIWRSGPGVGSLEEEEKEILLAEADGAFRFPGGPVVSHARLTPSREEPQAWILIREGEEADLSGRVDEFRRVFGYVLIGALLLALVLSLALARQLTGPLATLREGTRRMAAGDLGTEIDVRSEDEIQDLAGEFNEMAGQLNELTTGLERKVAEKVAEREQLEMQLLQSERLSSVGLLAAGVAHEIHNPLATISMYAQMLREKADGPEQRKRLDVILEHIDRISEITRGLLNFSRRTDGRMGALDLHGTLEATLRLMGPELDRHGVKAELVRDEALPPVLGQETQLQQAFLNILMNSSQAMPGGGGLRVRTRLLEEERQAEVTIEDTGEGIDEKDIGRVFDPFFTTKEPGQGTGLGLAVTYGIVQSHGGRIEVTSRRGEGTQVTIRLPLAGKGDD